MKVLIAYDGSECSDIAINNLQSAGLPDTVQVLVISAADTFIPEDDETETETHPVVMKHIDRARQHAQEAVDNAKEAAERAKDKIQAIFPNWQIEARSQADSPAWAIVTTADSWQADLIIGGSHGYGFFHRARLGSVSEKILTEAKCSVRIAKKAEHPTNDPLRIVLAYDGSEDADLALNELIRRNFPRSTQIHVVSSIDLRMVTAMSYMSVFAEELLAATHDEDDALFRKMAEQAATKLRAAGYDASAHIMEGDPKKKIIKHAEEWQADAIMAGAHGTTRAERFLMGSVSSAIASRAHCTVEIVKPKYVRAERED